MILVTVADEAVVGAETCIEALSGATIMTGLSYLCFIQFDVIKQTPSV